MAWLQVILQKDDLDEDAFGRAKITQTYYVEGDGFVDLNDSLFAVDPTSGTKIPGRGDPYSATRPTARVSRRHPTRLTAKKVQIVVTFEDPTDGQLVVSLTALPARISSRGTSVMEEYVVDYDVPPKYVRNASGEPFDQGPQRKGKTRLYTIRKYVTLATLFALSNAEDTNNDRPQLIRGFLYDEDELLLSDVDFDDVQGNPGIFDASFTVEYKKGGWKDLALNVGYSELGGTGRVPITEKLNAGQSDEQLVPVAKPWPLDKDGHKLGPNDQPIVLEFWPYPQSSWSGVPLA